MTIKITRDNCCVTAFEPYTLTLHIDDLEDHYALKYLSMCNSKVPETLYKRANEGFRSGKYHGRADEIRIRTKKFLITLGTKIPLRG